MVIKWQPKKVEQNEAERQAVSLRFLTMNDWSQIYKWLRDPYILQLTFVVPGPSSPPAVAFSRESAIRYVDLLVNDASRVTFAIEVDSRHIGNVGVKDYNPDTKTCNCFIEIGEAEYRGKGIGKAAMMLLLEYAFSQLLVLRVSLEVLEFNEIAIRVYDRLGFQRTSRTGWHYDTNHQYWQVWGMSISSKRWKEMKKQFRFPPYLRLVSFQ